MIPHMYAIAFDLDTDALKKEYGDSYTNFYKDVRELLAAHGFSHKQGTLYYGDKSVTANGPALAIFELARKFPWIRNCVSDIRALQVLDSDDLIPWIERGSALGRRELMSRRMKMTRPGPPSQ